MIIIYLILYCNSVGVSAARCPNVNERPSSADCNQAAREVTRHWNVTHSTFKFDSPPPDGTTCQYTKFSLMDTQVIKLHITSEHSSIIKLKKVFMPYKSNYEICSNCYARSKTYNGLNKVNAQENTSCGWEWRILSNALMEKPKHSAKTEGW